ncbi:superinfection immunity protein [Stutzerimonas kunmingensis]|uniref:superinfection immunity protein n=1 Tax=Stutzerimonas kunmingensis TaxID=1211807 RepID=UPI00289F07FE|nr:superinfection immunity protein [Stutzerimonas kunmingensis]
MELLMLAAMVAVYFLPGLVAYKRDHQNAASIMLLNLFLGWTLLGWVGALVWSASAKKQT